MKDKQVCFLRNKLLVICGPTAVGKTALALHLSKVLDGELLSADSRQVYKGMDIVTGKDLPEDGTKIWLTDLVKPNEEFSVSQWREAAVRVIEACLPAGRDVGGRKKLPIVVGGTGFYIKALLEGIETIDIPRNEKLRVTLIGKRAEALYDILARLDPMRAASMNQSDRRNPRRLVRAIEVVRWKLEMATPATLARSAGGRGSANIDTLIIGLTAPNDILRERIEKRIDKMLKNGAENEVVAMLEQGAGWDSQSMSGVGYRQWRPYFEHKATKEEIVRRWKTDEWRYAKRQMTWFKKDKRIKWFNITTPGWEEKVEKLVQNWYNQE